MMARICVCAMLLIGLVISTVQAQPAAEGWTPELMLKVRRIGHVRPSSLFYYVAYTVTEAVMTEDRSEFVSQIWMASGDSRVGGKPTQLTFAAKSSTNPNWSPDGRFLAFTSDRSGKSNLYRLSTFGGESEQLTDVKSGVGLFAWSPNGKQIAFVMTDPLSDSDDKASKSKDDFRWVDRDFKMDRLHLLSVEKDKDGKRETRLLTPGNFTIGLAARPGGGSFDWSPDGKSIVFAHRKTPLADDWPTSDVSIVDVATGQIKSLAASGASEFSPLFSPDGKFVAMVVSDEPPSWAGNYSLQVIDVGGEVTKTLPSTPDRQPTLIGWSNDGTRLFFSETHGTLNRLSAINVESGKIDDLYSGDKLLRSFELNPKGPAFDVTGKASQRARETFGFVLEAPQRAPEACVARIDEFATKRPNDFAPNQVSRANAHLPKKAPLGNVEVIHWKSTDGQEIEGLLTYPVDYQAGTRVPLLLQIHGGPTGVFVQSFAGNAGNYPNAAFAARGFALLQPNPRGSSGYGKEFRFSNYQDWGGGDFRDLMAGVDHVIEKGVADPERLGVMGWSYGGYMTSWTITQTRRFKAASVGAAVTNLVSFTGTADIPGFLRDYLGGEPWDDVSLYRARSPLFQAKGVTTATLVQHGEADVRVPVTQGYEFYNALKQQGAPVEMLVLPRQPHGPTEPRMILKIMQTNLDWFEKHLNGAQAAGE
ncbi:MAG: S9 family peptidase [Planctomycetaceae bacterium]|nr:S9 family peptidase [Planctomycetaceae bacterium]